MNDDRWDSVDRLLDAALDRPPEDRVNFLREACGGDEALRAEVETLLAHHGNAGRFLEDPAIALMASPGAASADSAPALESGPMVGQQLGRYRVIAPSDPAGWARCTAPTILASGERSPSK